MDKLLIIKLIFLPDSINTNKDGRIDFKESINFILPIFIT